MRIFSRISALAALALIFFALAPSAGLCAGPRVAVLPWKVNATGDMGFVKNAMSDMLVSRLGAGQVELVRPDQAGKAVSAAKGEINDPEAFEAGKALKADFVLYGSLTILGSAVSLDARLVNIKTGEAAPFASRGDKLEAVIGLADRLASEVILYLNPRPEGASMPAPSPSAPPAPAATAPEAGMIIKADRSKEQPVQWKSADMEGAFIAMAAADLDRDGVRELVLISDHSLVVARYGASGLEVIKEIKDRKARNIAITSIDSDNDGAPEVYVSRVSGDRPRSLLLEHKNGDYAVSASDLGWMLRAVSVGGGAQVLAGQRYRGIDGFHGDLKRLRKQGAGLVEEGPLGVDLPRGVHVFGFEAFNFTGAEGRELAALDDRQYLTLYRMTEKGWDKGFKSSEYYGGTLNHLRPGDAGPGGKPIFIEGRLFQADLDRDGKAELILKRNTPGGLGRSADVPASFKSGEIISLSWDELGASTFENWRTRQVEGYISDFFIDDLDGDGNPEITMLVVTGTERMFGTVKSYILSYRISL